MARQRRRTPTATTPDVTVSDVKLSLTSNETFDFGSYKCHAHFHGTVVVNGKELPLHVQLCKEDETKQFWTAHGDVNEKEGTKQHSCPLCSGNRGRSGPEYDGKTAKAVAGPVFTALHALGFDVSTAHSYTPGGWSLFDMHADSPEALPDGRGRGIYVAHRTMFTCPVHGRISVTEYEPNV